MSAAPGAPAIGTQPANQFVVVGQTASFSVTATGNGPLTYQWKKNGVNITGGTGATTRTYTTPAMGYAGNGAGSVTSSSAKLLVNKTTTLQSYGYVANGSDGLYDKTECVQDNNTGLVWEGKTASAATSRLGTSTYINYDDVNSDQKLVSGSTYANPTQAEIDAITNSIGYRNSVRASNLCGYNDWRLPTNAELEGIVASGSSPTIDTTWFPNTQASFYWFSTPYVGVGSSLSAWGLYFYDGAIYSGNRYGRNFRVRLVR
ncbi:MAG: DUF1566 domain-containing protein [Rhodoferax sp.]|nr:DUF1566 domain-containing protein [Rhodoferax sp.]